MIGNKAILILIITIVYLRAETVNLSQPKNCNPSGNCGQAKHFEGYSDFGRFVDKYYPSNLSKQYDWSPQYSEPFLAGSFNQFELRKFATDGAYLYSISNHLLSIVKAYPAEQSQVVSTIQLEEDYYSPSILIYGDILAVIANINKQIIQQEDKTLVLLYNVSDRSKPSLKNNFTISGFYMNKYIIENGFMCLISQFKLSESKILPYYNFGNGRIPFSWSNIQYYAQQKDIYSRPIFLNVIAFDLNNPQTTFLTSSFVSQNLFVYTSRYHIYILVAKNLGHSTISKIVVNKKYIRPIALRTVSGKIYRQNQLSEFQGYLRILTTNISGNQTSTNVFVLDYYLNVYGSLTNIIKWGVSKCKFVKTKLYLVSKRSPDPFYVVDLSNPSLPALLGNAKFSRNYTYFQPYPTDQNMIVGYVEKQFLTKGNLYYRQLQISLLNITDLLSPKQTAYYKISNHTFYLRQSGISRFAFSYFLRFSQYFSFFHQKKRIVLSFFYLRFTLIQKFWHKLVVIW